MRICSQEHTSNTKHSWDKSWSSTGTQKQELTLCFCHLISATGKRKLTQSWLERHKLTDVREEGRLYVLVTGQSFHFEDLKTLHITSWNWASRPPFRLDQTLETQHKNVFYQSDCQKTNMINHNVCSETNTHTAMTQGIPRHSEYRPESELNEETFKQHPTEESCQSAVCPDSDVLEQRFLEENQQQQLRHSAAANLAATRLVNRNLCNPTNKPFSYRHIQQRPFLVFRLGTTLCQTPNLKANLWQNKGRMESETSFANHTSIQVSWPQQKSRQIIRSLRRMRNHPLFDDIKATNDITCPSWKHVRDQNDSAHVPIYGKPNLLRRNKASPKRYGTCGSRNCSCVNCS